MVGVSYFTCYDGGVRDGFYDYGVVAGDVVSVVTN